ncbi:hypothetical protein ACFV2U_28650 [Streptomyces sp. NPDC059697]|uniref:hypothetical protein n=1 Tax=Streptomyces sp. NPDC059697 TaxID=3346912 RepID=UPI00367A39C5
MFTDMKGALEAEALELTPTSSGQSAAASLVVARQARDKDDLADLLGALGLPCGEDDLVRLLPHLSAPDHPTTGDTMPANAFTATAASMATAPSTSARPSASRRANSPKPSSTPIRTPTPRTPTPAPRRRPARCPAARRTVTGSGPCSPGRRTTRPP